MARKTGSHSEITGPRVQAAALRLIAQHGFAAVSMRQIAAEVGVQAGALYNYTSDKQTLLFDLLRTHMEHLLEALAAVPQPRDPMARLEAFCRFHIAYHIERPNEVFISYMELRNLSAENFAAIEALRSRYEAHLDQILKDGKSAGQFALDDARVTTFAVIAMLTGVNTWYRDDGPLSKTDLADLYWTLVRRAVAA